MENSINILHRCCILFYDTTFLEDFGKIKKGEYFSSICLLMNEGIIEFYKNSEDSLPIINIRVVIQPFESDI